MEEDSSYLKYLIDEEIYQINEAEQKKIIDSKAEQEIETDQNPVFKNITVLFIDYTRKQGLPDVHHDYGPEGHLL